MTNEAKILLAILVIAAVLLIGYAIGESANDARMTNEAKLLAGVLIVGVTLLVGYAIFGWTGISRCTSGCVARASGADWVVVQLDLTGQPFRCWELHGVSIANESQSDGIYWEAENGNLVHVSGLYNRVQVAGESWEAAFSTLGLTRQQCQRVRESHKAPSDQNWGCPSPSDPPACPVCEDHLEPSSSEGL